MAAHNPAIVDVDLPWLDGHVRGDEQWTCSVLWNDVDNFILAIGDRITSLELVAPHADGAAATCELFLNGYRRTRTAQTHMLVVDEQIVAAPDIHMLHPPEDVRTGTFVQLVAAGGRSVHDPNSDQDFFDRCLNTRRIDVVRLNVTLPHALNPHERVHLRIGTCSRPPAEPVHVEPNHMELN